MFIQGRKYDKKNLKVYVFEIILKIIFYWKLLKYILARCYVTLS